MVLRAAECGLIAAECAVTEGSPRLRPRMRADGGCCRVLVGCERQRRDVPCAGDECGLQPFSTRLPVSVSGAESASFLLHLKEISPAPARQAVGFA
jgi:hypothetical protein